MFIGAHFWLAPDGAAFTSPSASTVSQDGEVWPDESEANWDTWALGIVESFSLDPKHGNKEVILSPSPGAVQARDVIIPYAIPELDFVLLQTGALAFQLALNTQELFANATTQFNPNAGGGPGIRGILHAQKYDHENNLVIDWRSWAFVELKGALKGAPKQMTKPEFVATLLYSDNNTGLIAES